jgi:hypothetical protein
MIDFEPETYELDCGVCESQTEVLVMNSEEEPQYCPMCGTPI